MRAEEIRESFLDFYVQRGHTRVRSSSLIPTDPTVLFTIAGMVQFKPYFLGSEPPPFPRATSVQKCFRTENIEDVGTNAKDCTFFEMLGNFSFGDYFKREACAWAWELLTERYGIHPSRLWVTVFESDDEAEAIWRDEVGVPPQRILRFPKEDNFWHMGVPGPCGPCTELYVDRGPAYGPEGERGPADAPGRYQEIYNLVFMQYVQDEPYHVVADLERTGVDTGMGLERLAQILQDVPTVFDTDLFAPIVRKAAEATGGSVPQRVLHILADHARAITFLMADGVVPSNEGRGYVLRRVLRRAVTKARLAGVEGPILPPLCEVVVERFAPAYPELAEQQGVVLEMVRREEERFTRTLDAGLGILSQEIAKARSHHGRRRLSGGVAFKLHDTYGLPLEVTHEVAADAGLEVDVGEFERLMEEQRERARRATDEEKGRGGELRLDLPPTEFLGYQELVAEAEVIGIVRGLEPVGLAGEGEEVEVVLDRTPFYPEGGGQVGDRGLLESPQGRAQVLDTRPHGALILHRVRVTGGELRVGDRVRASVDPRHRSGVERSHTATHMVHHTLRELLGAHVRQMGSLVEPGRLRFDFSHYEAVPRDVLDEVEETVNARVLADDPVRWFETSYEEAVGRLGAIAFFGDKYGETVRVVEVGDYSRELCGGTHVPHTGRVGLIKLVSEGSIGSNLRRVEWLCGLEGLRYVNARLRALERAAAELRVPPEQIEAGIQRLQRAQRSLERELETQQRQRVASAEGELVAAARDLDGARLVVARRSEDTETLRELARVVRDRLGRGVVILGTVDAGAPRLVCAASKALGLDAREVVRAGAPHIGGGGGGDPTLAMAGGRNAEGLDAALEAAARAAEELLGR